MRPRDQADGGIWCKRGKGAKSMSLPRTGFKQQIIQPWKAIIQDFDFSSWSFFGVHCGSDVIPLNTVIISSILPYETQTSGPKPNVRWPVPAGHGVCSGGGTSAEDLNASLVLQQPVTETASGSGALGNVRGTESWKGSWIDGVIGWLFFE